MATDICIRRLTKELKSLKKDPIESPKITVAPNESNILEMHYVIEGGEKTPYHDGIYWGKLIFPKEYPLKPPSVIMLTPSGRFHCNRRLCLSMSDFHPESWNPMWSVSTILTGLYSFMIETSPTLGSIETTNIQKQKFAWQSLEHNVRDPTFRKLFPEYVELHKKRKAEQGSTETNNGGASSAAISHDSPAVLMRANQFDAQGVFTTLTGIFVAILSVLFAMRYF